MVGGRIFFTDGMIIHMRKPVSRMKAGGEYAMLEVLRRYGIAVPAFTSDLRGIAGIGLPAFLVTVGGDGMHAKTAITRYGDIAPAMGRAAQSGKKIYFAQCVTGDEVACGVMVEGKKALPLVPVDLIPRSRHEAVPHLTERQIERVQKLARDAHVALGASAHSCVRCVVKGYEAFVVSVDLSPALSPGSAFMQSASVAGVTVADLRSNRAPKLL